MHWLFKGANNELSDGRTDDVLELVDVVGEVENHETRILQSNLTDESIFVVVNTNLLLRLQQQQRTTTACERDESATTTH